MRERGGLGHAQRLGLTAASAITSTRQRRSKTCAATGAEPAPAIARTRQRRRTARCAATGAEPAPAITRTRQRRRTAPCAATGADPRTSHHPYQATKEDRGCAATGGDPRTSQPGITTGGAGHAQRLGLTAASAITSTRQRRRNTPCAATGVDDPKVRSNRESHRLAGRLAGTRAELIARAAAKAAPRPPLTAIAMAGVIAFEATTPPRSTIQRP